MTHDNRKRSRVPMDIEAVLAWGNLHKHPVRILNMSLKGVLCEPEPELGRVDRCTLTVSLSRTIGFHVEARVVRNDATGLALDFESMDEEAFLHLRNLVRYHSDDPDAIDRELVRPAFEVSRKE
ncbi:hypothetical protein NNJEOMEG_03034 [Fundidesulfovibrio magnetotacticus]|uniref:PilZ domain-containing protein n=1 Tax=Fundidesulfovibrio magnetotacticus TaxID=2730080 RepID=A0A6V8LZG6_9BACT|nr:PilZ domain-containing protein [Fundidesulfovibrio magnetotacticus]GFK95176.1 hypothetical protein NNJEOMEG_03034 [Fundidesulfovibrio magnetotacticus]